MLPILYVLLGAVGGAVLSGNDSKPARRHRRGTRAMKPSVGKQAPQLRRAPIVECDVFPWLADEVDQHVDSIPGAIGLDASQVTLATLRAVYPNTPAGEPIDWPSCFDDCPTIKAIEDRVFLRVSFHLAFRADELAEKAWYESGGR